MCCHYHSVDEDNVSVICVWFCDKGASTPPAIAATPVPTLPPIAVNSYSAVPAPPSGQSASETLYTNGVHQYQGEAPPTVSSVMIKRSVFYFCNMFRCLCRHSLHLSSSVPFLYILQLRALPWILFSRRTLECSITLVRHPGFIHFPTFCIFSACFMQMIIIVFIFKKNLFFFRHDHLFNVSRIACNYFTKRVERILGIFIHCIQRQCFWLYNYAVFMNHEPVHSHISCCVWFGWSAVPTSAHASCSANPTASAAAAARR